MNKVLNFERFNRVSNQREKVGYCALYDEPDRAVLNFYGDICMYDCSGYGGEFANDKCPQQVADFFNQIEPDKPVEIHFNSGGGDVFAGIAIANIIKAHAERPSDMWTALPPVSPPSYCVPATGWSFAPVRK